MVNKTVPKGVGVVIKKETERLTRVLQRYLGVVNKRVTKETEERRG